MEFPAKRVIAAEKITKYLLNVTAEDGKADLYFRFGFTLSSWEVLRDALLSHADSSPVLSVTPAKFGTVFVLVGPLTPPSGRRPDVRAVWQNDHGTDAARLITAYRARRR